MVLVEIFLSIHRNYRLACVAGWLAGWRALFVDDADDVLGFSVVFSLSCAFFCVLEHHPAVQKSCWAPRVLEGGLYVNVMIRKQTSHLDLCFETIEASN